MKKAQAIALSVLFALQTGCALTKKQTFKSLETGEEICGRSYSVKGPAGVAVFEDIKEGKDCIYFFKEMPAKEATVIEGEWSYKDGKKMAIRMAEYGIRPQKRPEPRKIENKATGPLLTLNEGR